MRLAPTMIYVGTAAWSLPKRHRDCFPPHGSLLERYGCRMPAVEINSSFYRPHRPATYARWAATVPEHFRFAVKIPKVITHERRFVDIEPALDRFLGEARELGAKLGCLLVQLPPSFAFDPTLSARFYGTLRERFDGFVATEPRHVTWFTDEAERLLVEHRVARVAADPLCHPAGGEPAAWEGLVYVRLHGSPRMYYSNYEPDYLEQLAARLQAYEKNDRPVWCIFDNTAYDHATRNALDLLAMMGRIAELPPPAPPPVPATKTRREKTRENGAEPALNRLQEDRTRAAAPEVKRTTRPARKTLRRR